MKSMTGFGEGEARGPQGRCAVQIQSVNGKYGKITANLPREFAALEPRVRDLLRERIGRGQVTVSVSHAPPGGSAERATVDEAACRHLASQLGRVRAGLRLEGRLDLATLVATGAVVRRESLGVPRRSAWGLLRRALEDACDGLDRSRAREGRAIARDIARRRGRVASLVDGVDRLRGRSARAHEARIRGKLRRLLAGVPVDEARLLAEASVYADRVDITEEIVRLRAHLDHFRGHLAARGEIGKRLDFTVQEMMREANTCANKACDARISRLVIGIKAELEKMREQIQNVQ
ncbi:MAG: YicC family protein [bacterium]|nr:YicC family protein [bacterium]